jgi:hypothetical protein
VANFNDVQDYYIGFARSGQPASQPSGPFIAGAAVYGDQYAAVV